MIDELAMFDLRSLIRPLVSDEALGCIDFYRSPEWRDNWGGPFNGQRRRQELFAAILAALKPAAIVETGTFRGATTVHFAETGLPVYTVESHPRNYGFARARLRRCKNVVMFKCDSREGLRRILGGPLRGKLCEPLFFYLDAHWNADLPLAEELDIIFNRAARAVVMIDDFQVPGDNGYGYDDYGGESLLNRAYIQPHISKFELSVLYPKASSEHETGSRRGCVSLARIEETVAISSAGLTREV